MWWQFFIFVKASSHLRVWTKVQTKFCIFVTSFTLVPVTFGFMLQLWECAKNYTWHPFVPASSPAGAASPYTRHWLVWRQSFSLVSPLSLKTIDITTFLSLNATEAHFMLRYPWNLHCPFTTTWQHICKFLLALIADTCLRCCTILNQLTIAWQNFL